MRVDHMIRGPRAGLGETSCSAVTTLETSKQRESMVQPEAWCVPEDGKFLRERLCRCTEAEVQRGRPLIISLGGKGRYRLRHLTSPHVSFKTRFSVDKARLSKTVGMGEEVRIYKHFAPGPLNYFLALPETSANSKVERRLESVCAICLWDGANAFWKDFCIKLGTKHFQAPAARKTKT